MDTALLRGDLSMSTAPLPSPKIRPYLWDRGKHTEVPGAMVYSGGSRAFVPVQDLRRIADALHDRADQLEQETGR